MKRVVAEGTGISPWEAEVLVGSINEVYFSDPDLKELSCGQTRYSCVSAAEGPGKPLSACSMVTVTLTLIDPEDRAELPVEDKQIVERLNRTCRFHTRSRSGRKSLEGTKALTTLFVAYDNFLRPHGSLNGEPPFRSSEFDDIRTLQGRWLKRLELAA